MKKNEIVKSWIASYLKGVVAEQQKLVDSCKEMEALTDGWIIVERDTWKEPYGSIYSRKDGKIGITLSVHSPAGCYMGFQDEKVEEEDLDISTTFEDLIGDIYGLELADLDRMADIIAQAKVKRRRELGLPAHSPENAKIQP